MNSSKVRIGVNEKLTVQQSLFYGMQSLLACNLFLGPFVLIGVFQMEVSLAAAFIGMTFLACGIATIIQAGFFLKMQVIQGMSFATFGAVIAVVMGADFATLVGALMVTSIMIVLLGYFRLFSKFVRKFIPGLVAGTVIVVIGISLMPITFTSILDLPGSPGVNFLIAGVTFFSLLFFMRLGRSENTLSKALNIGGVIYAMAIGTFVASFFGQVDLTPVVSAPWFAIPRLFPFGAPKFEIGSIMVFAVIMIISMVESIGTWFTITEMSDDAVDDERMDRGVIGEGLGVLIGSLVGGLPVSSYASNTGVLVVTKVFSRYAAIAAGVVAVILAFSPKLMYLMAIIPSSVVWGVYGIVCIAILMSGFNSIKNYPITERNNLVVGISVLATIGAGLLPAAVTNAMPGIIGYLFQASIAIGCITAVVANLVLPENTEDRIAVNPITDVNNS
ncbi:xanthine/uracil permease [Clostridium aceticum]|uniref:Xanthine/uracil permease n=1 Tax=Clostridium aceticum TaxID=84022 RepID=A0A0D8IF77_9CLOT|nr:solute carrier family 23 protein [Clostridium aceticum]AKL93937.1 xanthine/uracil permease [Clostridium aceticum]KJF28677.1 xanthine permease [Clostridium aceticum]